MSYKGLSEKQVLELREKFGENVIPFKKEAGWLSVLFSQFKSPLIYILFMVGLVSVASRQYLDAGLVLSVAIINVWMGLFQDYNAKKTLHALKMILKPKTVVFRNGQRKEVEVRELVPDDIVFLNSGDRIPADGKFIEGANLLVNEAILTGESEAIIKTEQDGKNLLFMGTTVFGGRAVMEVLKTGEETEMGKIGQSLAEIKEEKTPLQKSFGAFAKTLAYIILVVCLIIFITGVLYKHNTVEMFRMAIILAVAAVPEGLPIAITVILALGMRRVLKRKGLVKTMLSVETLGSTSIICTDKTGTLTEGNMRVVKTDFVDRDRALVALSLTNEQRSSLEVAILDYIKKEEVVNLQQIFDSTRRIYEEPFDSSKKYAMTINEVGGWQRAFVVGAPEIILSFCKNLEQERKEISEKILSWATEGLKIVGVAFKDTENLKEKKDFLWLGLIGIADPIRKEAKEAIEIAQKAGIKVIIVTGDYKRTAEIVAANLGFKLEPKNILEGQELEAISEEELKNKIDDIMLFTRVTPFHKQKIVKVLQEKGEVVAMTGDGVNDAPALKKADIGVVVGSASDVAKEASDLVLLDSNFKTIVAACEEGRLIFSNIKKVVAYTLSDAFAELAVIFGAILLKWPAPLTIAQILWIHLICDGPPDIALAFEPKERALMKEAPKDHKKENIIDNFIKLLIFVLSLTVGILSILLFWHFGLRQGDLNLGRTLCFAALATTTLIYVFACKNFRKPIIKTEHLFKNKYLFLSVAYGFLLLLAAIYLPFLNRILGTVPLKFIYWLPVFGVAIVSTAVVELVKILKIKNKL